MLSFLARDGLSAQVINGEAFMVLDGARSWYYHCSDLKRVISTNWEPQRHVASERFGRF